LRRCSLLLEKELRGFSKPAIQALKLHAWPGNIRELINCIRRAVVLSEGEWITPENLGLQLAMQPIEPGYNGMGLKEAIQQFEINLVTDALSRAKGNVNLAASALKTTRASIYHLINKHSLKDIIASLVLPIIISGGAFIYLRYANLVH